MKNLTKEQHEDLIYLVNEALGSVKSPYASFIPTATLKDVKEQLEEIRKIL